MPVRKKGRKMFAEQIKMWEQLNEKSKTIKTMKVQDIIMTAPKKID